MNIWIGNAVKRLSGLSGVNGTKVSAPMAIRGAVSPMARLTAKITPVKMPGGAWGNTI